MDAFICSNLDNFVFTSKRENFFFKWNVWLKVVNCFLIDRLIHLLLLLDTQEYRKYIFGYKVAN